MVREGKRGSDYKDSDRWIGRDGRLCREEVTEGEKKWIYFMFIMYFKSSHRTYTTQRQQKRMERMDFLSIFVLFAFCAIQGEEGRIQSMIAL